MDNLHKLSEIVANFGNGFFQIVSAIAIIAGGLTARKAHKATSKKRNSKKK
ncbi:hypothetical protein [Rothia nasimurium]|uniref:hypothetical protein n=1 Tax=Rothia nasimurium TaxID=85336 RepID=UPI001431795D|nr:hypothetical protein [Rothia nasimurium]MBF0809327.1 hypothetical protein [Rothia nasimurium]